MTFWQRIQSILNFITAGWVAAPVAPAPTMPTYSPPPGAAIKAQAEALGSAGTVLLAEAKALPTGASLVSGAQVQAAAGDAAEARLRAALASAPPAAPKP